MDLSAGTSPCSMRRTRCNSSDVKPVQHQGNVHTAPATAPANALHAQTAFSFNDAELIAAAAEADLCGRASPSPSPVSLGTPFSPSAAASDRSSSMPPTAASVCAGGDSDSVGHLQFARHSAGGDMLSRSYGHNVSDEAALRNTGGGRKSNSARRITRLLPGGRSRSNSNPRDPSAKDPKDTPTATTPSNTDGCTSPGPPTAASSTTASTASRSGRSVRAGSGIRPRFSFRRGNRERSSSTGSDNDPTTCPHDWDLYQSYKREMQECRRNMPPPPPPPPRSFGPGEGSPVDGVTSPGGDDAARVPRRCSHCLESNNLLRFCSDCGGLVCSCCASNDVCDHLPPDEFTPMCFGGVVMPHGRRALLRAASSTSSTSSSGLRRPSLDAGYVEPDGLREQAQVTGSTAQEACAHSALAEPSALVGQPLAAVKEEAVMATGSGRSGQGPALEAQGALMRERAGSSAMRAAHAAAVSALNASTARGHSNMSRSQHHHHSSSSSSVPVAQPTPNLTTSAAAFCRPATGEPSEYADLLGMSASDEDVVVPPLCQAMPEAPPRRSTPPAMPQATNAHALPPVAGALHSAVVSAGMENATVGVVGASAAAGAVTHTAMPASELIYVPRGASVRAKKVLTPFRQGAFYIRPSSSRPNSLILVVLCDGEIKNMTIEKRPLAGVMGNDILHELNEDARSGSSSSDSSTEDGSFVYVFGMTVFPQLALLVTHFRVHSLAEQFPKVDTVLSRACGTHAYEEPLATTDREALNPWAFRGVKRSASSPVPAQHHAHSITSEAATECQSMTNAHAEPTLVLSSAAVAARRGFTEAHDVAGVWAANASSEPSALPLLADEPFAGVGVLSEVYDTAPNVFSTSPLWNPQAVGGCTSVFASMLDMPQPDVSNVSPVGGTVFANMDFGAAAQDVPTALQPAPAVAIAQAQPQAVVRQPEQEIDALAPLPVAPSKTVASGSVKKVESSSSSALSSIV